MILIGPLPASLNDVTDAWAAEPVGAWVTHEGPVSLPRVRHAGGTAATEADARAFIADMAWIGLRAERDRRLSATDFRVVPDAPWNTGPWVAYRQALRDMPETTTDPLAPSWPTEPT
jgi:hypothetical protein